MATTLEISTEILDCLMRDNIGIADISNDVLIDKGRLGSWHGTILTSYTLNCGR